MSGVTAWICTPIQPRSRGPGLFSCATTIFGGIGRNVEADADRAARRRKDRGVDADHVAVDVEGRAAGIAALIGASIWM